LLVEAFSHIGRMAVASGEWMSKLELLAEEFFLCFEDWKESDG
jgi:hypothetical protein